MTRQELHAKLDILLDDAERSRTYGTVEFELRDGKIICCARSRLKNLRTEGTQPMPLNPNTSFKRRVETESVGEVPWKTHFDGCAREMAGALELLAKNREDDSFSPAWMRS